MPVKNKELFNLDLDPDADSDHHKIESPLSLEKSNLS